MPGEKMFCSVCSVTLNSYGQFAVHQQGKAHKRKEQIALSGANSASAGTPPVAKIVGSSPLIRFVSSKESQPPEGGVETKDETAPTTAEQASALNQATYCTVCVVQLTSQAQADMHFSGAKHKKALSLTNETVSEDQPEGGKRKYDQICDVCNIPLLTKTVAEAHFAGSKHAKKLRLSQTIGQQEQLPQPVLGPGAAYQTQVAASVKAGVNNQQFYCNFCKVSLNSEMQMEAHRLGSKHKAAVSGNPPPRKKPFVPRLPNPETMNRVVSPGFYLPPPENGGYHHSNQGMPPYRPGPPPMSFPYPDY